METNNAAEGYEYRRYIFISKEGTSCKYLVLDEDCPNDNFSPARGRYIYYNIKFGPGHAGVMFKIETKINGTSVKYGKKGVAPFDVWKRSEDKLVWQAEQRVFEDLENLKKEASTDIIKNHLKPLKQAYFDLSTQLERTLFLARVIAAITNQPIPKNKP